MKKIFILVLLVVLPWQIWKFFQTSSSYLKKKTEKIIRLSSIKPTESDIALYSRVSKIVKYIHFNIQMKAEYEGRIYTSKSLNEFRSLLISYFKHNSTGAFNYKNLTVQLKNETSGVVNFDAIFKKNKKSTFCKIILEWTKEKKWYVTKIEVFSCKSS